MFYRTEFAKNVAGRKLSTTRYSFLRQSHLCFSVLMLTNNFYSRAMSEIARRMPYVSQNFRSIGCRLEHAVEQ